MLEIKGLACGYDSKFFLRDINLKVNSGEFVGIIGPNGSGKTTLLRAVTRILDVRQGEILLDGTNVKKMSYREISKKIAVVSQGTDVRFITVEDFVLLGRLPHYRRFQFLESKRDMEIARDCLTVTGIIKLSNQLMDEISSGEKQLAFIARALAQEPELLLLDEPTAHLDITHQVGILSLIRKLNKEMGLTVIVVLHDLNLAGEYCDRLVLLNNGRLHKSGSPVEVLTYETIEDVYKTRVVTGENPVTTRPHIFLVT
ncbi:MAG: ABC transporter ATP-binding protein [Elusimicrobia bacterium]|nr:ABC transporter ATP-binding protein [Elusimicrobiota bacterium]